jgi:hypothetical protein
MLIRKVVELERPPRRNEVRLRSKRRNEIKNADSNIAARADKNVCTPPDWMDSSSAL